MTALCHGLLLGAATRHTTIARTEPEAPTVQYLTAYSNGWEAGQLASLGLVMSLLTGRSPTEIVDEALTHAAVDAAFPSGLHMPSADHEAA